MVLLVSLTVLSLVFRTTLANIVPIAAVYTNSVSRALRVASKIKSGTVGINQVFFPSPTVPFGGFKQSGYGRELGKAGIMAYVQEKSISINMAV